MAATQKRNHWAGKLGCEPVRERKNYYKGCCLAARWKEVESVWPIWDIDIWQGQTTWWGESKSEKLREKTSFQILLGPLMHVFWRTPSRGTGFRGQTNKQEPGIREWCSLKDKKAAILGWAIIWWNQPDCCSTLHFLSLCRRHST